MVSYWTGHVHAVCWAPIHAVYFVPACRCVSTKIQGSGFSLPTSRPQTNHLQIAIIQNAVLRATSHLYIKLKKENAPVLRAKETQIFSTNRNFCVFFHCAHPSNYRCLNWSCKPIMGSTSSIVLKSLLVVTSNRPKCLVNQKIRALMEKILQLLG